MKSKGSTWIKALACSYLAVAALGVTAADMGKLDRSHIRSDYKTSMEACKSLAGNPNDVCRAEAKANKEKAEAKMKAEASPSAKNSRKMQEEYAEADYKVAMAKCDAATGNAKDVCKKEAKAVKVTALENAKTNKEVAERKSDSANAKNDAAYAVAKEKCDSYAGAAKDKCLAEIKLSYGK